VEGISAAIRELHGNIAGLQRPQCGKDYIQVIFEMEQQE
jgi:hypothetical protein